MDWRALNDTIVYRMMVYKAMFKYVDGGVHAEVLDFPGVITFGRDLEPVTK